MWKYLREVMGVRDTGAEGGGVKGARLEGALPAPRPLVAAGAGVGVRGGGRMGAAAGEAGAASSSRVG